MSSSSEGTSDLPDHPSLPHGGAIERVPESGLVIATLPAEDDSIPEAWRAWVDE